MQEKMTKAVASLIFATCIFTAAGAATRPEDAIKYRHAVMESAAGHMNAFLMIASNKVEAGQYLQNHADAIADLTSELDILFPAGSGEGDTEALPVIWTDSEKFSEAIHNMQETAAKLQKTARSGDTKAIMVAFKAAGKACKNCHESFREKDEEEHEH